MGGYSGYDMLIGALEDNGVPVHGIWPGRLPCRRITGKFLQCALGFIQHSPFYGQTHLWAELRAWLKGGLTGELIHILYGENNFGLLSSLPRRGSCKLLVTLHQPYSWWLESGMDLRTFFINVDALIVLSSNELALFSGILGEKVHFVPHGIDTDFFHPADMTQVGQVASQEPQRCLVVGQWMRDFDALDEVVRRVVASGTVCFDLVVPDMSARIAEVEGRLQALCNHQQVTRYVGIDDLKLRDLYQNANLLFMPLKESTANNAILEAMGCGLPIVTSLTGGVVDYVNSDFARICAPRDYDSMTAAIHDITSNVALQLKMRKAARLHAEKFFTWDVVGKDLVAIYGSLASNP
jgi:glycosyltransferase involved in cell wall biosynthesis